MKRLLLLRHAKSSWAEPAQSDSDRALSPRGVREAAIIADSVAATRPAPDRILCSHARRTRETLAALLPVLNAAPDITISQTLYNEAGADYISSIEEMSGDADVVLLIGHNPTIHVTALTLCGGGKDESRALLAAKYPPGSLAILDFQIADWTELAPGTGTLMDFICPRDLDTGHDS
jgi:phosphohistidine phosphatase